MTGRCRFAPAIIAMLLLVAIMTMPPATTDEGAADAYTSTLSPHDPIIIESKNDFNRPNGVTGGKGTAANPYVIEGWEIVVPSGSGIIVRDTDVYFIIRNVRIHSTYVGTGVCFGIVFERVGNGVVQDVDVSGFARGVDILSSSHCRLSSSSVTSQHIQHAQIWGVVVEWSSNITVTNCTLYGMYSDFWIFGSKNVSVFGNTLESCGLYTSGDQETHHNSHTIPSNNSVDGRPILYFAKQEGLVIDGASAGQIIVASCQHVRVRGMHLSAPTARIDMAYVDDVMVQDCNLSGTSAGMFAQNFNDVVLSECNFSDSSDGAVLCFGTGATVIGNSFCRNGHSGLSIALAQNVTVVNNKVQGNQIGISSDFGSEGVLIYWNVFLGNTVQAECVTVGTSWDKGYPDGGNYWSDYTGVDGDGDGIGDTPYVISQYVSDRYPLMSQDVPSANSPPIVSPLANISTRVGIEMTFLAKASDPDMDGLRYTWDFGDSSGLVVGSPVRHMYKEVGTHVYTLFVDDIHGHNVSSSALVVVNPYALNLVPGWNLTTVPLVNHSYKASTLGLMFGDLVARWDSATQSYDKGYIVGISPSTADFDILPSHGYWVCAGAAESLELDGDFPTSTQTRSIVIPTGGGWVIVGLASLRTTWYASDIPPMYSGKMIAVVDFYPPSGYIPYFVGIPSTDFRLVPGHAYWCFCEDSGVLTYDP